MSENPRNERYDIPNADILDVDVWNETAEDTPKASARSGAARCPRCGAAVSASAVRCPSCERKLPRCSGSCSMCGFDRCVRSAD